MKHVHFKLKSYGVFKIIASITLSADRVGVMRQSVCIWAKKTTHTTLFTFVAAVAAVVLAVALPRHGDAAVVGAPVLILLARHVLATSLVLIKSLIDLDYL